MTVQPNIYKTYTETTGLFLTPFTADRLDDAIEDYGENDVVYALTQAKKYGKTSWNYILAILRNNLTNKDRDNQMQEAYELFLNE